MAPITEERCCLDLPSLHAAMLQLCKDAFAEAFPWSLNLLLLDNRGGYTAEHPILPANVRLVFWAPSCPELNPSARVWRDLKEALT